MLQTTEERKETEEERNGEKEKEGRREQRESPQTSPQIPGQIHSPVENQQRQSSGGLPTHRPAHPLPQALTLAWFKRLPLKTPTVINTLPFSCCFFFFIPTILGWLLNPMLA